MSLPKLDLKECITRFREGKCPFGVNCFSTERELVLVEALSVAWDALDRIQKACCEWDAEGKPSRKCKSEECKSARKAYEALHRIEELGKNV